MQIFHVIEDLQKIEDYYFRVYKKGRHERHDHPHAMMSELLLVKLRSLRLRVFACFSSQILFSTNLTSQLFSKCSIVRDSNLFVKVIETSQKIMNTRTMTIMQIHKAHDVKPVVVTRLENNKCWKKETRQESISKGHLWLHPPFFSKAITAAMHAAHREALEKLRSL